MWVLVPKRLVQAGPEKSTVTRAMFVNLSERWLIPGNHTGCLLSQASAGCLFNYKEDWPKSPWFLTFFHRSSHAWGPQSPTSIPISLQFQSCTAALHPGALTSYSQRSAMSWKVGGSGASSRWTKFLLKGEEDLATERSEGDRRWGCPQGRLPDPPPPLCVHAGNDQTWLKK